MIRMPSGKLVPALGCFYLLRDFPGVEQYRFVQEEPDRIVVCLVSPEPWLEDTVSRLQTQLLDLLREPVHIEVLFVESIPDDGPKYKTFVSRLPRSTSGNAAAPARTSPLPAVKLPENSLDKSEHLLQSSSVTGFSEPIL